LTLLVGQREEHRARTNCHLIPAGSLPEEMEEKMEEELDNPGSPGKMPLFNTEVVVVSRLLHVDLLGGLLLHCRVVCC